MRKNNLKNEMQKSSQRINPYKIKLERTFFYKFSIKFFFQPYGKQNPKLFKNIKNK